MLSLLSRPYAFFFTKTAKAEKKKMKKGRGGPTPTGPPAERYAPNGADLYAKLLLTGTAKG